MRVLFASVLRLVSICVLVLFALPRAVSDWTTLLFFGGDNDVVEEFVAFTLPPLIGAALLYALAPRLARLIVREDAPQVMLRRRDVEGVGMTLIGVIVIAFSLPTLFGGLGSLFFPTPTFGEVPGATGRLTFYYVGTATQFLFGLLLIVLGRRGRA